MSQIYQPRRRGRTAPAEIQKQAPTPGPSLHELAAGARPSAEQMGRRVDLPDAIREKMEASFGADFSGVRLYESPTVEEAGAEAMTMGSNVAFAPGQLDLASTSGQALLGHELSHMVSQARGESAGRGFLADQGLEAQADRQGLLAAQGESAYAGPVTPLSASAVPASAAGVAQAKKKKDVAREALDQGAQGGIPEGVDPGEAMMDTIQKRGHRPRDTNMQLLTRQGASDSYYEYASQRLATMTDRRERNKFLNILTQGTMKDIHSYIKQDALDTTQSMTGASAAMNSESFKARAAAYAGSGATAARSQALQTLSPEFLGVLLGKEGAAAFQSASENFSGDREMAKYSMEAYATGVDENSQGLRRSDRQRNLRKAYRKARRGGKGADALRGNRARQAEPWRLEYSFPPDLDEAD